MPGKGKTKNRFLRLDLDTDELYEAFQEIKKHEGIRSNTDVLRNLILDKYRTIKRGRDYQFLEDTIYEFFESREKEREKQKETNSGN